MYVQKTPPTPPQNTPFPALNLKVGKMNYSLGKVDPTGNLAKCLKSGQNFSRSGRKKYSSAGTALLLKLLFAAACSNVQRAAIWFLAVLHSLPDLYYSIMQAQNSYWLDCSAVQPTCDSAMLLAA